MKQVSTSKKNPEDKVKAVKSKDSLKPYKFAVTAVAQQVDSKGNIVGEVQAEPVVIFGCTALEQWARDFPTKLAKAETSKAELTQ